MEKAVILVEGLRIRANHGVMPQENLVGNIFEISLRLSYPPALDGMNDDLIIHTLNYATVVDIVKKVMATSSQLLENVAGRIYSELTDAFPMIDGGEITVKKLSPPISAELGAVGFCYSWTSVGR